ncbi:putative DNA-binding protein [Priestia taiwanensis]|uniref:UPF0122 protein GCM10007140_14920 n=1 Tax=Priestia taiwanensis TaxID=1347902 RepID=A0A917EQB7_9BACI|nr:putative DNA-binding protein [Priestia taiwanensis]MBM7362868.1 putative DNA-binding protein YlxM (UPF0122 family) [Priestia taiwanensis]GGE65795.1 UPF0122 protein [Priestia taiwanensis]
MNLDKTMRMNYLYDFYQSLLTPKQRSYMSLYYLEDYSLGEIAEEFDVSRQAVYDNIKRTETMLEQYEEKLLLLKKFQERQQLVLQLKSILDETQASDEIKQIVDTIEKLD